jgi:hypothetical protein
MSACCSCFTDSTCVASSAIQVGCRSRARLAVSHAAASPRRPGSVKNVCPLRIGSLWPGSVLQHTSGCVAVRVPQPDRHVYSTAGEDSTLALATSGWLAKFPFVAAALRRLCCYWRLGGSTGNVIVCGANNAVFVGCESYTAACANRTAVSVDRQQ